jgi:hypothetical protein
VVISVNLYLTRGHYISVTQCHLDKHSSDENSIS